MSEVDEQGRPEPPLDGDELATLLGFLDFQRATFAWRCRDLDDDGFRVTVAASTITLGGLLKHLAAVEEGWFQEWLLGRTPAPPFDSTDEEWFWTSAADDTPAELLAMWDGAVQRSRAAVAEATATAGLDQPMAKRWPDGRAPSLRWLLAHMIEEYARHNGHADLIRESIDGQVGE